MFSNSDTWTSTCFWANGYWIFLLKGFFDSLSKDLYDAADIDGAGEWRKFWTITISLSKPILAVIALGAFTGAYSNFMFALIIVPDQSMWTLMVWIYRLQITSPQAVVYASLCLAAIPTFVVFVLTQNVMMRGIVVPQKRVCPLPGFSHLLRCRGDGTRRHVLDGLWMFAHVGAAFHSMLFQSIFRHNREDL